MAFIRSNQYSYTSNIGMTIKSYSNRLNFLLNRSTYLSGSTESCVENVVSKRWILRFPQMFCWMQFRNQSLFQSDTETTTEKGTNSRMRVTCESESHLLLSFNRSKSSSEKLSKLGRHNFTLLTVQCELCLI